MARAQRVRGGRREERRRELMARIQPIKEVGSPRPPERAEKHPIGKLIPIIKPHPGFRSPAKSPERKFEIQPIRKRVAKIPAVPEAKRVTPQKPSGRHK